MNILGTGLSGLVGSRVVDLLSPHFDFENLSLETGIDITNRKLLNRHIQESKASWVFHFAAKTDVDGCEQERFHGHWSDTWKINVQATQQIVEACKKTGKRLLFISTDYVFDGTKDQYTEDDTPNPQGWYAISKYEAERSVTKLGNEGVIVRIANPYRAHQVGKLDFVHKVINLLSQSKKVVSVADQQFVPTFIDDIANAIAVLIELNATGIYHVVGSQGLSPSEAAKKIAKAFDFNEKLISETTFEAYFRGRAPRPRHAVLKHDKITRLGVRMRSFDEGLAEVKYQSASLHL